MTFLPIDKLPVFPSTLAPVEGERAAPRDLAPAVAPLDPHSVLAMDAWPATGPRLFDALTQDTESAAPTTAGAEDLDQAAAHVIAFLV